ncbi:hypothetical protein KKE60_00265 [Patescibacteria group bacterium]|nr:hypothetical protein [Patescibacteria group bacterium]MBU0777223.1 hypothetical protein [Patescibacteria group bacterium]MBU0922945.1 hypothetical protein [Patescibacteria group bacterium]MBU1066222.1 hypothetical protein [Patescibacteria group bacterium]MBU1844567.1 hypothetical protein [Patescibacteria group bacterium]
MAVSTPENYPATLEPTPPGTPVVQIKQKPTRNKFFKPALIVFCIVLVVVISEVGYLVFKGYNETYIQPHPTVTPAPTPLLSPPTLEDIQATFSREHVSSNKVRDFADILDTLAPKLEFIQNASLNFTVAGWLVESSSEKIEEGGVNYAHQIILEARSGKILTYLLTEQEVQNAIVFLITSTGPNPVKISEIMPGDFVSIRSIANLLDPGPYFIIVLEAIRE